MMLEKKTTEFIEALSSAAPAPGGGGAAAAVGVFAAALGIFVTNLTGKKVTVVGRSMVIGKPLSMLLLGKNATITVCHTRTVNLAEECRKAEVLVAAAGKAKMITGDMVGEAAVVVDVGINVDEAGNMCGDVDFHTVENIASYISPVPKGVGSVTTSVLAKHVVKSAKYLYGLA